MLFGLTTSSAENLTVVSAKVNNLFKAFLYLVNNIVKSIDFCSAAAEAWQSGFRTTYKLSTGLNIYVYITVISALINSSLQ